MRLTASEKKGAGTVVPNTLRAVPATLSDRLFFVPLLVAAVVVGTVTALTNAGSGDAPELSQDQQTLRAAGLGTDNAALLGFFHERARLKADGEKMLALARQLGDRSSDVRSKAAVQLVSRGSAAIPALRHVLNDLDSPMAAEQATKCLEWLESSRRGELPIAAARLLAARKSPEAAKALLAYLPFADDSSVIDGVKAALVLLAGPPGNPDQALLRALQDPLPLRRAIAAEVLCAAGQPKVLPEIRKLLRDPKSMVRLRAALALSEQLDEEAVHVLIDLLAELSPAQRRQAEEALQQLAGDWSPNPTLTGDDEVSRKIRRDAWVAWWRNTDGPALVAAFQKRTLDPGDVAAVRSLVDKLGDKVFANRERAEAELVALGPKTVPLLRVAAESRDLEQAQRAKNCLKQIAQQEDKNKLPAAAARLLAVRRPPGATAALLAYLPYTDEEFMKVEVGKTLKHLVAAAGKADPILIEALGDSLPARRAVAAEVLAGAGASEHLPEVRKLLQDPDTGVRLRVAVALTYAGQRDAVPVLIDLVADAPKGKAWEAEDLLYHLAGAKAPHSAAPDNAASRKKFREDWQAWWKTEGASVDLAQLRGAPAVLGFTLVVEFSQNGNNGRVVELDRSGKMRWQIDNLAFPVDAHLLPGNRILVVEGNGNRVTERDLKGTILWQANNLTPGGYPVNAQRLANGNTFIACANTGQLLEIDRAGKTVFSINVPGGIRAAYKMANGQMVCLTQQAMCIRLDPTGKEIKRFAIARMNNYTSGIDVTPKGNVLVAQGDNTVAEYDPDGKIVWQAKANLNTSATRLFNGHTLVASHNGQNVVELDSTGKVVWEYRAPAGFMPFRARQR